MRILLIADYEEKELWGKWSAVMEDKHSKVNLILSADDLNANYLDFLTDRLRVPLVYVPGNHDYNYVEKSPKRCIDADGRIIDFMIGKEKVEIIGFSGSMRYKEGPFQFSEVQQRERVRKIAEQLAACRSDDNVIKIMLTHAQCRGYGDMEDLAHRGFECLTRY